MNKLLRVILFFAAIALYLFLLEGCKKDKSVDNSGTEENGNTNDHSNTGNNGNTSTCTTVLADAENIQLFPSDNPWNEDISSSAIDPYNTQIISSFSSNIIKADFGSGLWDNAPIGIPYTVVCGSQAKLPVTFIDYGDESDAGPYAIPLDAPIEGNGEGDSHVISVDKDNGVLYELYNAHVNNGHWEASSGAIFNLNSNELRPETWTSADAAGLPIFPGLVRYEEILKGAINHPLRFTLQSSKVKPGYVYPARHEVNSSGGQYTLPFGARIRLKANFDISGYSATNQVILNAMKKYGLILADIGSNLYVSGAPDERWDNDDLHKLGQVHGSDFEVVKFNN
ncbi:MAG: hypothetical protein QM764_08710 [Chitinophagaceae bacterium]